MEKKSVRCLLLACGNSLRGDDGAGPWLAKWAAERFSSTAGVRTIARMQWTPELAQDLAEAESVIFIDASTVAAPGVTQIRTVTPAEESPGIATHHLGAAELLAMSRRLYGSLPCDCLLLTIGVGSTEMGEKFSAPVEQALPQACSLLEEAVLRLLATPSGESPS